MISTEVGRLDTYFIHHTKMHFTANWSLLGILYFRVPRTLGFYNRISNNVDTYSLGVV